MLVQGKPLKIVDNLKQLGGQLSNDGSMRDEIPWRMQQSSASFSSCTRDYEKKAHTIKDKDKDFQDNGHAMYTICGRNVESQLRTNCQPKWNSIQTTQDHFRQKLVQQNLTC